MKKISFLFNIVLVIVLVYVLVSVPLSQYRYAKYEEQLNRMNACITSFIKEYSRFPESEQELIDNKYIIYTDYTNKNANAVYDFEISNDGSRKYYKRQSICLQTIKINYDINVMDGLYIKDNKLYDTKGKEIFLIQSSSEIVKELCMRISIEWFNELMSSSKQD